MVGEFPHMDAKRTEDFRKMLLEMASEIRGQEAETADQFGDGEPAAFGLITALRPYYLILGGVGHGHAGPVDDFHMPPQPQLLGADGTLQFGSRVRLDIVQVVQRQSCSGLTVGSGRRAGDRQASRRVPRLDLTDDLTAGTGRGHDLGKKCPEGDQHGVRSLAAIGAMCGRLKESGRCPGLTDAGQLTERAIAQRGHAGMELSLHGRLRTSEQDTVEAGKEGR